MGLVLADVVVVPVAVAVLLAVAEVLVPVPVADVAVAVDDALVEDAPVAVPDGSSLASAQYDLYHD